MLADFGLSRISHEATTTILQGAGSPRWMAPELIMVANEEAGPLKSPKTDVYAFGHIILEVCASLLPLMLHSWLIPEYSSQVLGNCKPFFHLKEDLHVIVDIINNRRSPRPTGPIAGFWLDDSTWAYCQTCTAINPDDRPDMEVVIADLHQLFDNISVSSTENN